MRWFSRLLGFASLYAFYLWLKRSTQTDPAAFAAGEVAPHNFVQVRNAGPDAMPSRQENWDKVDQASDESFPASDAGAKY